MSPFLNLQKTAETLGLDENGVRELVRAGHLREFRDAGQIFFKSDEVMEYQTKQAEPVDPNDFKQANGQIDGEAFQEARANAGEKCYKCDTFIDQPLGQRTLCLECKDIEKPDKLWHSHLIRCPKCGDTCSPWDNEDPELLGDGDHRVVCKSCEHEFMIMTLVSHTFVSPKKGVDKFSCLG